MHKSWIPKLIEKQNGGPRVDLTVYSISWAEFELKLDFQHSKLGNARSTPAVRSGLEFGGPIRGDWELKIVDLSESGGQLNLDC